MAIVSVWRAGVGTVLMERAMQVARQAHDGAIRLTASLNAVAFYERFGFRVTARTVFPRNDVLVPVAEMDYRPSVS